MFYYMKRTHFYHYQTILIFMVVNKCIFFKFRRLSRSFFATLFWFYLKANMPYNWLFITHSVCNVCTLPIRRTRYKHQHLLPLERHAGRPASQWQQTPDGPEEAGQEDGDEAAARSGSEGHGMPVPEEPSEKTLHRLRRMETLWLLHPVHHHGQLRVFGCVHTVMWRRYNWDPVRKISTSFFNPIYSSLCM